MHTHCSDGTDSPVELLHKAKAAGLQAISITDHDTVEAYSPELFSLAEDLGLQLLSGVELSSEWKDRSVHVLGYGCDLKSVSLRSFLSNLIEKRNERNRAILAKLSKKGFVIHEKELFALGIRTIGRPHIAQLMVNKGYVGSFQEAFHRYLQDGASCYTPGIKYTPAQVIHEIHQAHGKAVLAHPHFFPRGSFLKELLELPFDGIECYYAALHPEQEKPWLQIARERRWIATGGSDYHGTLKPHISLGCSWVGLETFQTLLHPH
jgi:hypothetical protein